MMRHPLCLGGTEAVVSVLSQVRPALEVRWVGCVRWGGADPWNGGVGMRWVCVPGKVCYLDGFAQDWSEMLLLCFRFRSRRAWTIAQTGQLVYMC